MHTPHKLFFSGDGHIITVMNKQQRFYKIYSNLPINLREEVIAVIDNEPLTWKVAKLEIDGKTKLGEEILEKLASQNII